MRRHSGEREKALGIERIDVPESCTAFLSIAFDIVSE